MIVTRRQYLLFCLGLLSGVIPLSACTGKSENLPDGKLLSDLLPLLPNEPLIAEAYASRYPKAQTESLKEILDSLNVEHAIYHESSELLAMINRQIQGDYSSGDTVDIAGWQFARTEVRIISARTRLKR